MRDPSSLPQVPISVRLLFASIKLSVFSFNEKKNQNKKNNNNSNKKIK